MQWGAPLMASTAPDDAFRSHWLAGPVELFLVDRSPADPPIAIEVRAGDEPMTIETADGRVCARRGAADEPVLVLAGDPQLILGLLSGRLPLAQAHARGLHSEGDERALARLMPSGIG